MVQLVDLLGKKLKEKRSSCALATIAVLLALSLGVAPCAQSFASQGHKDVPAKAMSGGAIKSSTINESENELIVTYKDKDDSGFRMQDTTESSLLQKHGLTKGETLVPASSDGGSIATVGIPQGKSSESALAELAADPAVAAVQPNYHYFLSDAPHLTPEQALPLSKSSFKAQDLFSLAAQVVNDPYCKPSGEKNQYYLYGSKMVQAWQLAKSNEKISVAVLDTGCRLDHEDLKASLEREYAYDAHNNQALKLSAQQGIVPNGDRVGHGTHVSGIVGASANNALGIAGASYNAKILPIKVFDDTADPRAATSDIIKGFNYLRGLIKDGKVSNLRVINMSLGYYPPAGSAPDTLFEKAINSMRTTYGVLTVCSGGNGDEEGDPLTLRSVPSDYDACLSVTSLNERGENSYWSDYNKYKDISTYGTSLFSTYSSSPGAYRRMSGTSMAAPVVSGAAALVWAANKNLSVDQVVKALESTAKPLDDPINDRSQTSGSHGSLDAQAAVASVLS